MFQDSGLLVGRFDQQLYAVLETLNSSLLRTIFPRAPGWWPLDWGKVPITLPLEVSLYRSQLVAAPDSTALWLELYQLFLEQIAAGWDLEFHDRKKPKVHRLPINVAQAIMGSGGFAFLSPTSNTLEKFRSHHQLMGEPIPVQRAANQQAWTRISLLRAQERSTNVNPSVPVPVVPAPSVPAPSAAVSAGAPFVGPPGPQQEGELWAVLGASQLQGELRQALAGESEIGVGSVGRVVALATAALRMGNRMEGARATLHELAQSPLRSAEPVAFDNELNRQLAALPLLARSLPRLFHTELGRIQGNLGRG